LLEYIVLKIPAEDLVGGLQLFFRSFPGCRSSLPWFRSWSFVAKVAKRDELRKLLEEAYIDPRRITFEDLLASCCDLKCFPPALVSENSSNTPR